MSSEDKWFKRWGRMPFGPWSYADVEEMMKEMEKDFMATADIEKLVPRELVREKREEDGSVTREIGPIVYGYSMTVGPDGKPVVREFGNAKRGPRKEWIEAISETREPLVEVVEGEKEVRVIAELPGAKEKDIELTAVAGSLIISADAPVRKYRRELVVPSSVDLSKLKSTFNNGVLEVILPKRRGKPTRARIRVD